MLKIKKTFENAFPVAKKTLIIVHFLSEAFVEISLKKPLAAFQQSLFFKKMKKTIYPIIL